MRHLKLNFNLTSAVLGMGAALSLNACSPASAPYHVDTPYVEPAKAEVPHYDMPAEQTFQWVREDGGQSQLDFNPQVDILFVTDNSDSMKVSQENLRNNIERFASGIISNKMIDYHIGVTSVWDSSDRFAQANKAEDGKPQIGDLRLIRGSTDQRYVTKANRSRATLAASIDIGVASYDKGGPENEEFFAPLTAAMEKTGHGATNEGFFRPDAQLVVIIMTDADEYSTSLAPDAMARKLVDFKGGRADKVSVYGVLVKKNTPDEYKDWALRIHPKYHSECFNMTLKEPKLNGTCKEGFGPETLEKFIVAANPNSGTPDQIRAKHIMNIRSEKFGADLEVIGKAITIKTLEKDIYLQQRPRTENNKLMVRVMYGDQVIPQKEESGWLYDPTNNSIHLSGNIKYNYVEGARFTVDLMPLTLK